MIYLDSAAVVKLVHAEPESAALRGWLDERAETPWISSVLTEIESFRALARYAPEAAFRLPAIMDQIDLIDVDQRIRMLARAVTPGNKPPRRARCTPPRRWSPRSAGLPRPRPRSRSTLGCFPVGRR